RARRRGHEPGCYPATDGPPRPPGGSPNPLRTRRTPSPALPCPSLAASQIPDEHRRVAQAGREQSAVGGTCAGFGTGTRTIEHASHLPGRRLVDVNLARFLARGDGEAPGIGRERDRPRVAGQGERVPLLARGQVPQLNGLRTCGRVARDSPAPGTGEEELV